MRRSSVPVPKGDRSGPASAQAIDYAWKTLTHTTDLIKHVEAKNGVTLAAAAATAGILFNLMRTAPTVSPLLATVASACGLATLLTGVCCGLVLWPRLSRHTAPRNSLFFYHIAVCHQRDPEEFRRLARTTYGDQQALMTEVVNQVWCCAHVARKKYRWHAYALITLLTSLILLSASAVLVITA
jgi:cytochrome bd-type quinol oxidase subunit 2